MRTNKNYLVKGFKGGSSSPYPDFTVPAGSICTHQTACGEDKNYHFLADFNFLPLINGVKQYGLIHDLIYYGLNIPKEYIQD